MGEGTFITEVDVLVEVLQILVGTYRFHRLYISFRVPYEHQWHGGWGLLLCVHIYFIIFYFTEVNAG